MSKYPIKKEFFPYNHIKFRLNRRTIALAQNYMKVPKFFWNDPEVATEKHLFQSYDGAEIELYLLTPKRVSGPLFLPDKTADNIVYASPVQAERLDGLPEAYIETAEFDSIHDDGVLYAQLLRETGVAVELHETEGTMHGFDIALNAPTTRAMVEQRIDFMRRMFE